MANPTGKAEKTAREADQALKAFWQRATRLARYGLLGAAAALYALAPGGRALALGLLVGGTASMLRFQISYTVLRAGGSAAALVRTRMLNYAISGAALVLAFAAPQTFSPWTTVPGLLAMNAAVIAAELLWPTPTGGGRPKPAKRNS